MKELATADLYLASAISILLNTQPNFRGSNGKVLFVFPASDELYKAMNDYNNGIPLNSYEFAQTIKRIRAEMLIRKGGKDETGKTYIQRV